MPFSQVVPKQVFTPFYRLLNSHASVVLKLVDSHSHPPLFKPLQNHFFFILAGKEQIYFSLKSQDNVFSFI